MLVGSNFIKGSKNLRKYFIDSIMQSLSIAWELFDCASAETDIKLSEKLLKFKVGHQKKNELKISLPNHSLKPLNTISIN